MRTYSELKEVMERKKYKFFLSNLSLNCIWERTSDEITNHFTDFLHIAYLQLNPKSKLLKSVVITIPTTTKPGLKGSILEPTTVNGVTGTAIIKPGQYLGTWEFRDTSFEFSKYPYFRQIGLIDYWRDGDKDTHIDKIQDQENKLFGTHWHIMSQIGTYGSGQVNNWSLGCMGAAEPEFKKILPIIRKSVKLYGNKFSGTILESKDFS
jgi:hypothetical protein